MENAVDLRERAISDEQAADLRRRLACVAEDWDSPEMDVYDQLPLALFPPDLPK